MKKFAIAVIGSLFLSAVLVSCGPTKEDAIKYNDELIKEQTKVLEAESAIFDAVTNNPSKLDASFESLKSQVKESTEAVEKMKAFDGKTDFKDALLKLFTTFKGLNEKEFAEYISIGKLQGNDFTPEKGDRMISLGKTIDDAVLKANDDFIKTQKEFAAKYKFELSK